MKVDLTALEAKNEEQAEYIRGIAENKIIFCTGIAGSGKSFLSIGVALQHLKRGSVNRLIIARPVVYCGNDLGSMPGFLDDKLEPFFFSAEDTIIKLIGVEEYKYFCKQKKIIFKPIEVMRGATFDNCYIICDDSQNMTEQQLKLLLTRLGDNCKMIINGDVAQADTRSFILNKVIDKLTDIDGIFHIELKISLRNKLINIIAERLES